MALGNSSPTKLVHLGLELRVLFVGDSETVDPRSISESSDLRDAQWLSQSNWNGSLATEERVVCDDVLGVLGAFWVEIFEGFAYLCENWSQALIEGAFVKTCCETCVKIVEPGSHGAPCCGSFAKPSFPRKESLLTKVVAVVVIIFVTVYCRKIPGGN